jgi:hypothetical protein
MTLTVENDSSDALLRSRTPRFPTTLFSCGLSLVIELLLRSYRDRHLRALSLLIANRSLDLTVADGMSSSSTRPAASDRVIAPSNILFNTCNRACSFCINISPFMD